MTSTTFAFLRIVSCCWIFGTSVAFVVVPPFTRIRVVHRGSRHSHRKASNGRYSNSNNDNENKSNDNKSNKNNDDEATPIPLPVVESEVVGASGRIGSLFLTSAARAVPKGLAPGCLSSPGTPIFVTTPAKVWSQILHDTVPERREDLVWIGNGLPPPVGSSSEGSTSITNSNSEGTIVVPHFGVLKANAAPVTSPESPPTYIYGKHAAAVECILRTNGITTIEIVSTYQDIMVAAAQKLLWAASMWLLCHSRSSLSDYGIDDFTINRNDNDNDDNAPAPITALQVHTLLANELDALVRQELFPALCALLPGAVSITSSDAALDYLLQYSQSMPTAIASRDLGREEWKERNAFFLQARKVSADRGSGSGTHSDGDGVPQPLHEELLRRVGGISEGDLAQTSGGRIATTSADSPFGKRRKIPIPHMNLTAIGIADSSRPTSIKSVIIVGGGIIGSSIALQLARQGITRISIVDLQSQREFGVTTPASWAWLNANGKAPPGYGWLNQLGMDGWRRDPLLNKMPTWSGSLVRFREPQSILGGYRYEGPLEDSRIRELEPATNLQDSQQSAGSNGTTTPTYIYYYPDEGLVDPSQAVEVVRREAANLGVRFVKSCNVTAFIRDKEEGPITGVTMLGADGNSSTMNADVVVLAAGTGSADLGKIPLLHRPGQLAFVNPRNKQDCPSLQRILVDTVRESHILQQKDGTLVVGGGALEVGGSSRGALATEGLRQEDSKPCDSHPLLETAGEIVPGVLGALVRTEQAVRPIPMDGLPACGFLQPGLYAIVTHSGMTPAPILSVLAASEISQQVCIETLDPFRPLRFFPLH